MPQKPIPPGHCKTPEDLTAYYYRAQEKLRKQHNRMADKYRDGQITEAEWKLYLSEDFEPISDAIVEGILAARQEIKDQNKWDSDIPIEE